MRWSGLLQKHDDGFVAAAHSQQVVCNAPVLLDEEQMVMVYDAKVSYGVHAYLDIDGHSRVVPIPADQRPWAVKEVCAGICGISMGLSACGFVRVASMDINEYMCEMQIKNGLNNVICGDLLQPMDRWLLHSTPSPERCTLVGGFPCQPLSSQGDQKGAEDVRALPFFALTKMMWEQRFCAAIFECVPAAMAAPYIQVAIQQLGWSMGMHFAQTILHLHDTWPCRRSRWWMMMVPLQYQLHGLLPLPADPGLCHFGQLFASMPSWTASEIDELAVTDEEMAMFQDERYGMDRRLLHLNRPVPCILHSYGFALTGCPCGCRQSGFVKSRLLTGGLRGFFVIDKDSQKPRYLHVKEAALLCGIDPNFNFGASARDGLCLVGQCASPLQAFWMGLHLRAALYGDVTPSGAEMAMMKRFLLRQAYGLWQFPGLQQVMVVDEEEEQWFTPYIITTLQRPMIAEILLAESRLANLGQIVNGIDDYGRLPATYKVGPGSLIGPVVLQRRNKKRKITTNKEEINYQIAYFEDGEIKLHCSNLPAGSFVFEAFAKFGILVGLKGIQDDVGRDYRADDRLWNDTTLLTYHNRGHKALRGQGDGVDHHGLDSTVLNRQVKQQLMYAMPNSFVWLDAEVGTDLILNDEVDEEQLYMLMTAYWRTVATALAYEDHWTLITFHIIGRTMHIHLWDGLDWPAQQTIQTFTRKVRHCLDIRESVIYLDRGYDQTSPHTCGTVCLLHMGFLLGLWAENDAPEEEEWHQLLMMQHDPMAKLQAKGKGGNVDKSSADLEQELIWKPRDLLRDKGVAEAHTEERVLAAIKKIGMEKLNEAIQMKNPWNALKALGSQPRINFLWIKPEELERQIRARAASKFQVSRSHQKNSNGRSKRLDMVMDPTLLELLPDSFETEEKDPVRPLPMSSVGSERSGVAFGSVADVLPFLREGKSLTTDALAVLTTAPVPPESHGLLPVVQLRYPAKYLPTGEPVLIDGSLVSTWRYLGRESHPCRHY